MAAPVISNAATNRSTTCGGVAPGDAAETRVVRHRAVVSKSGLYRVVTSVPRWMLMVLIRGYQLLVSPLLPPSCRFHPSCSHYGLEAVGRHGALKGGWLTLMRLVRCHPFHPGGLDPVPHRWRLWPPSSQQHILTD